MSWLSLTARRSIPLGFLGMLALIGVGESFVSRNDLRFSHFDADAWKATRTAAHHLPAGGVLLFGDSQIEFGISPITVESRLGQPTQSLALRRAQPPATYFLLREALQSGAVPAAIVVNFAPHLLEFDLDWNERFWPELANVDECLDLAQTLGAPSVFGPLALSRLLPSYLERQQIRENLMAGFRGETPTMPLSIQMTRRNRGMNRGAFLLTKRPPDFQHETGPWGVPRKPIWTPAPANEAYIHRFLQLAAKHQIPVFCAVMPVVSKLKRLSESSGEEKAYYAWLGKLLVRYPQLRILDWRSSGYPDSMFIDAIHLDVEGAVSTGLALADYLAVHLKEAGTGERWVRMPPFRSDGSQFAIEHHIISDRIVRTATDQLRR